MLEAIVDAIVPALAILLMTVVGLELQVEDFRRAARQFRLVAIAIMLQLVLTPLAALAVVAILHPQPYIAAGIVLVALCPSGGMANFYSYLARANLALAVTLTAVSCVLAVFTMPLLFTVFRSQFSEQAAMTVPIPNLIGQLIVLLILPILVGMGVRSRWPGLAMRHGKKLLVLGLVALCTLLTLVIFQQRERLTSDFFQITWAVVLLSAIMIGAGLAISAICGWGERSGFPVAMVLAVRNVTIAAAVAVTVLGRVEFAVFATAYFINQTPLLLLAVGLFRLRRRKDSHPQEATSLAKAA